MEDSPEVFFHVGLGKVASTYLQKRFFPYLREIEYIPTSQFRKSKKIIQKSDHSKFLVSREFDRQLEREVDHFVKDFPQTRIIVVLRRHDSWVASHYKRYVKNGFSGSFQEFFDLKTDGGFWKKKDLLLYPKVRFLEQATGQRPLILFHDELLSDPWTFMDKISRFTSTSYDRDHISLAPVHRSFSEKQLKVLRAFCRRSKIERPRGYQNRWKNWLLFRPWWAFFHLILYAGDLFPPRWVPKGNLIPSEQLTAIRDHYHDDWARVRRFAEEQALITS